MSDRVLGKIPTVALGAVSKVVLPPRLASWRGSPWCVTIFGPNGTGKTWLAAKLAYEVASDPEMSQSPIPGTPLNLVWLNCATLRARLQQEIDNPPERDAKTRLVDSASAASLLVLDDLTAARGTAYVEENVRHIITSRYDSILPTIITADGGLEKLEPRLRSRMAEGVVHEMTGPDQRRHREKG